MEQRPSQPDEWQFLRNYTPARIALGRAGHSLPTSALLDFNLAHAQARDAVHSELNVQKLREKLTKIHSGNPEHSGPDVFLLKSQVENRQQYLLRPDLGRKLSAESTSLLTAHSAPPSDICFVVADGLSAQAVDAQAVPVLQRLVPTLKASGWSVAPLCLVEQGRVAIADEIGYLLRAEIVVILIGERPGLSSPDSLGAYLTYQPRPGLTDEARNCVSNIRPAGLGHDMAAQKLFYLLSEMKRKKLSGVGLKDDSELRIES
ncbi:MAG: ethanolamine ammonia-lyase subunit EutC [Cytophagaceae bacterium]|nr:ethanolamine ammonia-lyase subunit EutC [Cytophagaceae bacterium]